MPLIGQAQAPISESWHDMNGRTHFIFSTGISMGSCGAASAVLQPGYAELTGFIAALSIGMIWEFNGNMNAYDMAWNFAGCIIGTGLYILIKYIDKRVRQHKLRE